MKEIKSLGHIFSNYLSYQDFFIYIKNSIKNKNIIIKEIKDNQISIQFKQFSVFIDLMKKEVNCDLKDPNVFKKFSKLLMNNVKENNNIKKEIIEIKKKNKKLLGDNQNIKKEIKEIKEKNKKLFEENQIRKKENYDVITIYNCIILPYIVIRQPFNLEKKASWFHLIFRHINSNIP